MTRGELTDVAVIGAGYWGKNLVRVFHEMGVLRQVCDRDGAGLNALLGSHGGVEAMADPLEVLRSPNIRAVAIALPAAQHYELAKLALEAGKDVFVEKPLALRTDHARELVDIAKNRKRILMVGHLLQYHPAYIKLRQICGEGRLGRLQYIYSNRLSLGKIRREENSLWSFAPHDISMILGLAGDVPDSVLATGGNYLHNRIADVTLTHMSFSSGIQSHIFVSWLHPFKDQKLIVVGQSAMAVFEDTQPWERKVALYPHAINWTDGIPIPEKKPSEFIPLQESEPLMEECRHFLECVKSRSIPRTDGMEGLRVLQVLEAAQTSIDEGRTIHFQDSASGFFAHESAVIDSGAEIGKGSKVWHFSHLMPGSKIGEGCILGQNCHVAGNVVLGNNVKIQNNVSVYSGTVVEDDVFLGPSCVLTNVSNPRAQIDRHGLYEKTRIRKGATIGANATVVCGIEIGRYAFIAAGAVVTKSVPDYALMSGIPARRVGWMSRHGHKLKNPGGTGFLICPESGFRYREEGGRLRCLDLAEDESLPEAMRVGTMSFRDARKQQYNEIGNR